MIYILIFSLVFVIIFNKINFNKFFSFLNLIQIIWHIIAIISLFGFYKTFVPSTKTYIFILIFLYSIELGYYLFSKKFALNKQKKEDILVNQRLSWNFISVILLLCNITLLVCVIKSFPYLLEGLSSLRNAYLNNLIFSNKIRMLISIVVFSLGHAAGMYSIIDYIYNKKIRLSLILYILFLVEIILMTGGRGHILLPVGIVCIALLNKYKLNLKQMIVENKLIFAMAIVVLGIVLIISSQRRLQNQSLIYNIYAYFVGPVHLLGVYVDNPAKYLLTADNLLWGQILISGFSYPFTFILRLFDVPIMAGIYVAFEVTQSFTAISPTMLINNNCTALYYFLRDFGILGLIIIPLLLCYIANFMEYKTKREPTLKNKIFYYYFCYQFIFLLFSFKFAEPSVIFCFVFVFFIEKIALYIESKKINVSVILATKDTPLEFLRSSINSILQQTHKNLELIIVSDGGNDGQIIRENFKDQRIKIIENSENKGLAYSLNVALKQAKGKYIFRMDSDDISAKRRLMKQIIYMENHPNVVVCGMYAKIFGKEDSEILNIANSYDELKCGLLYNASLVHPTVCLRNEIIRENKIEYDEHFRYSQDYDMWIRMSQYGDIAIVQSLGLKYRIHEQQISTAKKEQQVAYCKEIIQHNSLDKFSLNKKEVLENLLILNGIKKITIKNSEKLATFIDKLKNDKVLMKNGYKYSDIKKTFNYRFLTLTVKNSLLKEALSKKEIRKHLLTCSNIFLTIKRLFVKIMSSYILKKEF